jgi:hypothetical protein
MFNGKTILGLTILLASAIVAARSVITAAPPAERKEITFLDHLKTGQAVSLTEKDGRYEISVFPPAYQPLGHKVVEIGPDYAVFRDLVGITDTIVPVYSIKAITVLRVGAK